MWRFMRKYDFLITPTLACPPFALNIRTDTKAPNTTLSKALRKGKYSFTFSADEQSTFTCKLDRAAAAPCTSPTTRKLKPGRHTFTVTATDTAGNPDATPATLTVRVKKP